MRSRRAAVSAVGLVVSASLIALPAARAASGSTIYVDSSSHCSDTAVGAGSSPLTPFCTVQAALAIVQPGDTVQTSGTLAPFTVSAAGTAAAPITIRTADPAPFQTMTVVQATGSLPAITVSGASYVNLSGFFAVGGTGSTLLVTGSNHIVVDSSSVLVHVDYATCTACDRRFLVRDDQP